LVVGKIFKIDMANLGKDVFREYLEARLRYAWAHSICTLFNPSLSALSYCFTRQCIASSFQVAFEIGVDQQSLSDSSTWRQCLLWLSVLASSLDCDTNQDVSFFICRDAGVLRV
jgi:hypothetical protein